MDVVVDVLLLQKKDRNYSSGEISLWKGKGEKEDEKTLSTPAALSYVPKVLFAPWSARGLPRPPTSPRQSLFCRASLRQEKNHLCCQVKNF